jgi:hypothetical protein
MEAGGQSAYVQRTKLSEASDCLGDNNLAALRWRDNSLFALTGGNVRLLPELAPSAPLPSMCYDSAMIWHYGPDSLCFVETLSGDVPMGEATAFISSTARHHLDYWTEYIAHSAIDGSVLTRDAGMDGTAVLKGKSSCNKLMTCEECYASRDLRKEW